MAMEPTYDELRDEVKALRDANARLQSENARLRDAATGSQPAARETFGKGSGFGSIFGGLL